MGAGLYDAAFATLGRLYGQSARGAITNLTLFGGFASTVCWPLSAFLVETAGWRGACLTYAGLQLAVALPIHLALLPRARRRWRTYRPTWTRAAAPLPPRPASPVRDRRHAFLLLAAALTLGSVIQGVVSVHLLTVLQARGCRACGRGGARRPRRPLAGRGPRGREAPGRALPPDLDHDGLDGPGRRRPGPAVGGLPDHGRLPRPLRRRRRDQLDRARARSRWPYSAPKATPP